MLDGSYLFAPDNPNHENSKVAGFGEHNHPISTVRFTEWIPGA